MSQSHSVKITMAYTDYSQRTYTLPTEYEQQSSTMKPKIQAFNTAAAIQSSDVAKTFLSDDGAPVSGIVAAEIVTIDEEVIYSA